MAAPIDTKLTKVTTTQEEHLKELELNTLILEDTKKALMQTLDALEIERAQLEKEKLKDEAILSSIGEGLVVTDHDMKVIRINEAGEKMLGWKQEEVLGQEWFKFVKVLDEHGKEIPLFETPFGIALTTTTTTSQFVRKNGTILPATIIASQIKMGPDLLGAVIVFRDITEEREIQQAKDDFLNIAAHDLRTPMSGIRANIEMLLAGDFGEIPAKFQIPLQDIDKANMSLIKMVDDFLTIGRMEKGKITIKPYPIDLLPILDFHVDYIKPLAEKRNLKFNSKIPVKLPQVMADANKIPEVISNLLDNAIKYTDKGLISLKVVVEKDSVVVKVADTGIGITKEQQKNIFQKYAQIDRGKRIAHGKGTGLGLGLYISRLIIEGCKGKIWCESELGKGSTFCFSLPIAK